MLSFRWCTSIVKRHFQFKCSGFVCRHVWEAPTWKTHWPAWSSRSCRWLSANNSKAFHQLECPMQYSLYHSLAANRMRRGLGRCPRRSTSRSSGTSLSRFSASHSMSWSAVFSRRASCFQQPTWSIRAQSRNASCHFTVRAFVRLFTLSFVWIASGQNNWAANFERRLDPSFLDGVTHRVRLERVAHAVVNGAPETRTGASTSPINTCAKYNHVNTTSPRSAACNDCELQVHTTAITSPRDTTDHSGMALCYCWSFILQSQIWCIIFPYWYRNLALQQDSKYLWYFS